MNMTEQQLKGLAKLRERVPDHLISRFPPNAGANANKEYVGHAAVTDRLLEADPAWTWKFLGGTPVFDDVGGIWIELTVCGVTRTGYGFPERLKGGNAIKEAIGDAIRNAAMRFGVGLELWHKGDLYAEEPKPQVMLTEAELRQIDALIALRQQHFEFNAIKFVDWLKKTYKVDGMDGITAAILPDVMHVLMTPPKGKEWPKGTDPRNNAQEGK